MSVNVEKTKLKDYLVPLTVDGTVPPEILVALKGMDKERVKRMWLNANNPYALAKSTLKGEAEIVGKPSSVYIKYMRNTPYYVLVFPSGKVLLSADDVDEATSELIQNELLYVKVLRRGNYYVATDVEPLIAKPKIERGKELREIAEKEGIRLEELPAIGYGYVTRSLLGTQQQENVERLTRLLLLRFFTTTKVNGLPIHAFELTTPNTGKTSFAVRNIYLLNWAYIDEAPSSAHLIMDARNNALGVVFRSDGVFIDEIDKYGKEMKGVLHVMLTGMSHGVWKRGKGDTEAPSVVRRIPVYFAGNRYLGQLSNTTPREYALDVLINIKMPSSLSEALLDRIAIVIRDVEPINASDFVSGYVIADSYLRGYVAYISELATKEYKDIGYATGRLRQHVNMLNALCKVATNVDNCEELAKNAEKGFDV